MELINDSVQNDLDEVDGNVTGLQDSLKSLSHTLQSLEY